MPLFLIIEYPDSLNFLLNPISPRSPVARKSLVRGSGTGIQNFGIGSGEI
jgi:hypothetical protein